MPWAPSPVLPSIMPTFHLEQEGSKPLSSPYTQERAWYKGPLSPSLRPVEEAWTLSQLKGEGGVASGVERLPH